MKSDDDRIKALVCEACWDGIFSARGWQSVLAGHEVPVRIGSSSKGFYYKTTGSAVRTAADRCNWCRLFARPKLVGEVEVLAVCEDSDCTPAGDQVLALIVRENGMPVLTGDYYMYTSPGMFSAGARIVETRDGIPGRVLTANHGDG
jgi:hypothetical protein